MCNNNNNKLYLLQEVTKISNTGIIESICM